MVLPIFKDDSLYKDVSIFFENLIDSTGKNDEEYNQLIQKHKEEHIKKLNDINLFEQDDINALENVPDSEAKKKIIKQKYDKKRKEVQRLEHLIKRLEFGYDSWGDYRLNDLIETVIKKIEFADKFNFETV